LRRQLADPEPFEQAIRIGPESSELYLEAAGLYAIRARSTLDEGIKTRSINRMFELLREGWHRGLTSKNLDQVASFHPPIRNDARWSELQSRKPADIEFTHAKLMPDPLSELSAPRVTIPPVVAQR